jgi:Ni/Co efflux regulator RcnB
MFRKIAIALVAASMLTVPVMAKAPAATKPATASTSSAAVKTVKADKTALKHRKHARAHHGTRVSQHKHMNGVKHARHFNKGKGHKVAGTTGKVVSSKPATRSN